MTKIPNRMLKCHCTPTCCPTHQALRCYRRRRTPLRNCLAQLLQCYSLPLLMHQLPSPPVSILNLTTTPFTLAVIGSMTCSMDTPTAFSLHLDFGSMFLQSCSMYFAISVWRTQDTLPLHLCNWTHLLPHCGKVSALTHNSLQVSYLSSHVDKLVIVIAFDTSVNFFMSFHPIHSTTLLSSYQNLQNTAQRWSDIIPNSIHILPMPSSRARNGNCKGFLSQSCLMVCSFDLWFTSVISGWDGSPSDSAILHDAHFTDFPIPLNKFYLAGTGFPLMPGMLVPYRGHHYHLNEWHHGNHQSSNKEELFNLCHTSAHNIIKRIFVIIKHCYWILATTSCKCGQISLFSLLCISAVWREKL